jgi:hypothetical protein
VWIPHLVHDRLAPDHFARVGHEQVQQVELARRRARRADRPW